MADLELVEGEYKRIYVTYNTSRVISVSAASTTPSVSSALDVSGASFSFGMKEDLDSSTYQAQVANASFVTTNASTGVVRFDLDATALNEPGYYLGQLKTTYKVDDIDSELFTIWVQKAVTE